MPELSAAAPQNRSEDITFAYINFEALTLKKAYMMAASAHTTSVV